MKTIVFYSIIVFCAFCSYTNMKAQDNSNNIETIEFKVYGNCGECKERIENAALIKGVKLAEWNKETDILKVVFNNKKTNKQTIQQSIAEAGHDTEEFKATDETYKKLPNCCAYRDGVGKH